MLWIIGKLDHWFLKLFPNRSRVMTITRNPCLPFSWSRATHTKEFPILANHRVLFAQALGKPSAFSTSRFSLQRHRHFFQGGCQIISWACLASTWATQQGALQIIPSLCQGKDSLSDCFSLLWHLNLSKLLHSYSGAYQAWLAGGGATVARGLSLRARAPGNSRPGKKLLVPGEFLCSSKFECPGKLPWVWV